MCGIIVCENGWEGFKAAEAVIAHRGGDGHKAVERDGIVFSHFLHSVVGHNIEQPFEGNGILAANCEIYNWKELAEKYGVDGRNDAEVLFKILENESRLERNITSILEDLDGDFACVYYRDGTVYAFRDPLGVNPLFYSLNPLLFASERKASRENLRELHPRTVMIYEVKGKRVNWIYNDFFGKPPHSGDLSRVLFSAVDKRIADMPFGILFSGGIDSIFIALRMREMNNPPTLYTAFTGENSIDAIQARRFAHEYGFEHVEVEFSRDELEHTLPALCGIIDSCDPVKIGVAAPLYFAARAARGGGKKVLYSGLGADDIFAGYARFKAPQVNIHNEQLSSLRSIHERDLYRDNTICMANNAELRVPFLDKELVRVSLTLPTQELEDKRVLRNVLKEHYGMDIAYYNRPKKAAQYGSNSMEMIRAIAEASGRTTGAYLVGISAIKNIRLASLYTGGKDSAYATYLMLKRNYDISCLITIASANPHSYMFHTPRIDVVKEHAERMGLPLVRIETRGEKEEELDDLERAIALAKERYSIEGVITGALYSDYQRMRIESVCDRLGLRVFSPLWHVDQEMHMRRLLKDGFRFIFTSVAAEGLDGSCWLNREITESDIDALVNLNKKYGINIAGEGGEFESLIIECPLFIKNLGRGVNEHAK